MTLDEVRNTSSPRNGIHAWTSKGIVGRGVLIDYVSYKQERNESFEPWSFEQIPVSTVKDIARQHNIKFETGDILFLRTGFIKAYESRSQQQLEEIMGASEYHYPGLAGSVESLEWLWDTHFAAVASDSPGFEAWSAGLGESKEQFRMHETILSGFGLPIGELFDLEDLAAQCKKHNRWEFFITSEPLNLVGGVGSPPNAIAIF